MPISCKLSCYSISPCGHIDNGHLSSLSNQSALFHYEKPKQHLMCLKMFKRNNQSESKQENNFSKIAKAIIICVWASTLAYMSSDGIRSHNMCDRVSFAKYFLLAWSAVCWRVFACFFILSLCLVLCLLLKSQKFMQIAVY